MTPLKLPVSDAKIWSVTLELSIMNLESSFDDRNMFIVQATVGQHYGRDHFNTVVRWCVSHCRSTSTLVYFLLARLELEDCMQSYHSGKLKPCQQILKYDGSD